MITSNHHFPALEEGIYADTAAAGLLYDDLLEWRREHDQKQIVGGSAAWPDKIATIDETRKTIGRFFAADDAEIALLPNFSLGLNLILEKQDPIQKVLLVENEYPSVSWPFEHRGFHIDYVKPGADMEADIADTVRSKGISILAISLVQWLNGILVEPGFLKKLKEDNPNLLIIADGTQHCGAFQLNFADSGIDVLGVSGYKWLLGGYGNGFLIIRKETAQQLPVPTTGFNSTSGDLNFDGPIALARHLEPGHLDSLSFGTLLYSMKLLNEFGMDKIDEHNSRLSAKAKAQFEEMGLLEDEVCARSVHSTIFRLKGGKDLYKYLLNNGIRCSLRAGGVRLSFHFYNTENEIDRIVEILKKRV